jgi:hypothetical protein
MGIGSGSAAGGMTQGSNDAKAADPTPSDRPALDKTDKMPVEDKAKPVDKVADKPADKVADKPADKVADKPADKITDKTVARTTDKPLAKVPDKVPARTPDKVKPVKPAVPDDDVLGGLQGGTKPSDKKPLEIKKPGDEPATKPSKPSTDTKGYVAITSNPSAKIAIDGKDTGLSTPITGHALPASPGKHKITFVIGGDKFTFSVTVKAGETASVHKDLQ